MANEAVQRFVEYERWKADKIERGVRAADAGEFASEQEMAAVSTATGKPPTNTDEGIGLHPHLFRLGPSRTAVGRARQ